MGVVFCLERRGFILDIPILKFASVSFKNNSVPHYFGFKRLKNVKGATYKVTIQWRFRA